ncbi:type II toxin-antitoxin system Phd/YefM family antitoxin [Candidatus Thiosymbion oneisti]|uniref:type II toxin-antitoxin system Phd/YefM family antitoxin n=1 Tax=Candidatus Thiosymbion oneisti TaxID=589554 RepID=UPI000AC7E355|nr:type II toxin-antitoxin system Phd/YefM family antitoxin [Candidatus Thiosymbion oneisti]
MDTVSINEFRGSFREHVDKVISEHEPLKVTGHKGADFMVIGAEDWEREQETLYVLGNRSLMEQITRSAQTHAASEGYRPTPEQIGEIDRL